MRDSHSSAAPDLFRTIKTAYRPMFSSSGWRVESHDNYPLNSVITTVADGFRTANLDLQPASLDIWDRKYRLRDSKGTPVDKTVDNTYERVARALADLEKEELRHHWYKRFLWALRQGAIPAGRILFNVGAGEHKAPTSTINCAVSGTIEDSMDDILSKVREAALTLKAGCGIGYDFSNLHPRGTAGNSVGKYISGPVSFMDIYDKMCLTITTDGGRRGAQMATFDVRHPDVMEFIKAKREDGRLRQFNLSLLITDEFIEAVKNDRQWKLIFPISQASVTNGSVDLRDTDTIVFAEWPNPGMDAVRNEEGLVACSIHRTLPAREMWDLIMSSNYEYAEPGFILVDRVNDMNNNWFCEDIRATNSCGEQGLPPYGTCLLGSINLTGFVSTPFSDRATFDWDRFRSTVSVFTRMLDNVVELHCLPLEQQREEITQKRRHGMGFLGLGSTITLMGMCYGSEESVRFTERVSREMALAGWRTGLELAREKGPAPIMNKQFTVTEDMLRKRPAMKAHYKVGDQVPGRILHARYSNYMQRIGAIDPGLLDDLAEVGARFTHHSSIAPTGTIALSLANNVSNGIEPSFAHEYSRNIIQEGRRTRQKVNVTSYELLLYRALVNPNAVPHADNPEDDLPTCFTSADQITPKDHVAIQAAAQVWIDSSISKTVNVPTEFPFDEFKDVYLDAYHQGLKGCSTFRFNPERFQGVLVKDQDLANTTYDFTLEDGSIVSASGSDEIEYDGEVHTAANLYDALKEGYY